MFRKNVTSGVPSSSTFSNSEGSMIFSVCAYTCFDHLGLSNEIVLFVLLEKRLT